MSLVHEALQKAEREKQRKTGLAPSGLGVPPKSAPVDQPLAETPKPHSSSPKSSQTLPAIIISCVSLVAIVAIVYLVIRATALRTSPAPPVSEGGSRSVATVPVPPADTPQVPVSPAISEASTPSPFKLSGIMKDPEGKYCAVINGRVVYEQQSVDGATIKNIERDRVTMDINGRETILRLF